MALVSLSLLKTETHHLCVSGICTCIDPFTDFLDNFTVNTSGVIDDSTDITYVTNSSYCAIQ